MFHKPVKKKNPRLLTINLDEPPRVFPARKEIMASSTEGQFYEVWDGDMKVMYAILPKEEPDSLYADIYFKTKVIMMANNSYAGPFWNESGYEIGDCHYLYVDDYEFDISSVIGLQEWQNKAERFDPYSETCEFCEKGMEEWINEGYRLSCQIRELLPIRIDLFYGYWHRFDGDKWRYCRACITRPEKGFTKI